MNESAEYYIHFCHDVSIDPEDMDKSLKKYILLHQKYINVKQVYDTLFPNEYINWTMIQMKNSSIQPVRGGVIREYLGDHWLRVLGLLSLGSYSLLKAAVPEAESTASAASVIPASMKEKCVCDFKTMHDILKRRGIMDEEILLMIILLKHIFYDSKSITESHSSSSFIIEQLLYAHEITDATKVSLSFSANMSDVHLSTEDHETHIKYVMSILKITPGVFLEYVKSSIANKRMNKEYVITTRNRLTQGRPRLSDKLRDIQRHQAAHPPITTTTTATSTATPTATSSDIISDANSFNEWSHVMRFPNTFSYASKCQIYFVMSQPYITNRHELVGHFIRCRFPFEHLNQRVISLPAIDIIHSTIQTCIYTGEPFADLVDFRRTCLCALRQSIVAVMTWTDVFRLYVCAYQHHAIWRELWKRLLSHMNTEIIRNVQIFTESNTFKHEYVILLFMRQNGIVVDGVDSIAPIAPIASSLQARSLVAVESLLPSE